MSAATVLTRTDDLDRSDWLNARRAGLGGSDAAAILGLDQFKSPLAVYLDKRGELKDDDAGEAAEWGNRLEPVVADAVRERINGQRTDDGLPALSFRQRHAILRHPTRDFMLANVDREVFGHEDGPAIFEAKTTGYWAAQGWEDGGDTLPDKYHIQLQHYLEVTGRTHGWIGVLVGGQRLVIEHVQRDQVLIDALVDIEARFWEQVKAGTPPPAVADDLDRVKALYPKADEGGAVVLPTDEIRELLGDYRAARAAKKAAEGRMKQADARIRQLLGDAEAGFLPGTDRPVVTCKEIERKGYEVAPTSYRRLWVAQEGA